MNITTVTFVTLFMLASLYTNVQAEVLPIEKLFDDTGIANEYQSATGYDPANPSHLATYGGVNYFGLYPMIAQGDILHLGIGTSLPGAFDGGALATYTDGATSLGSFFTLTDQGIMSLTAYDQFVTAPGADPCCGDVLGDAGAGTYTHQWDWGNFYMKSTVSDLVVFLKRRNLPNVVHGWGSWYDQQSSTLYYAASGHMADTLIVTDATLSGLLFSTTDGGSTWTKLADRNDGVGLYRTYDIIGIDDRLYASWADDAVDDCGIAKSLDGGASWDRIPSTQLTCSSRLYDVGGTLVTYGGNDEFLIVSSTDSVVRHSFAHLFSIVAYHTLSQDQYGNIYVPTTDGRVMHTTDFVTWTEIAHVGNGAISFNTSTFWDEKNKLMLGNWGSDANLWSVEIRNSDAQGLPDALVTTQEIPIHRFWSETSQSHFYTKSEQEKDQVIADYDDAVWRYEGIAMTGDESGELGQRPLYRFYSDVFSSHFYTLSETEKVLTQADPNWKYEGVQWYSFATAQTDTVPVYRFWNEKSKSHFYTISEAEKRMVEENGDWLLEGVVYHVRG